MNKQAVGKGAGYIYIENIVGIFSGYLLWLFLSKIATSEVIGTSSTAVSLAAIFTTIVTIGIPSGIPRFLAKSFSQHQLEDAKVLVKASILLVSSGILVCTTVILIARDWIFDDSINFTLIILSILLMGSSATVFLFRSVVIASLDTKILPIIMVVSSAVKVVLAVILILIGLGVVGIMIGYISSQIVASIFFVFSIVTILKSSNNKFTISFSDSYKRILSASFPSWIPDLITVIGTQLGIVTLFGLKGASETGIYFIAFSLFSGIAAITSSLFSIGYPALSVMHDGRKRFAWRLTKMSLVISLPLSSSIIFYSKDILGLLGRDYVEGSTSLEILLLSVLPIILIFGIKTLAYSYGNYRQVLEIGLASSIPRVALYFVLIGVAGATGAAISYSVGSIIGLAGSIIVAKKIGLLLFWRDLALILIIPTVLAFILDHFQVNYIMGIFATLIISYILFVKLQILSKSDTRDAMGILHNIASPIISLLNRLRTKLNRSY